MRLLTSIALITLVTGAYSGTRNLTRAFNSGVTNTNQLEIVDALLENELYFTAIPILKDYLADHSKVNRAGVDAALSKIVEGAGIKQFQILPETFLDRAKGPVASYILAKKLFRTGEYQRALEELNGTIPERHHIKPFALLVEGSIKSIMGHQDAAINVYERCKVLSLNVSSNGNELFAKILQVNHDYCQAGIARAFYAKREYEVSSKAYGRISKQSLVWPEILFEEAWSSFYQKDYNRTLGKLSTYNVPVLDFIFNPEIELLRARTLLELCMYEDTKKVVDLFYKHYQDDQKRLRIMVREQKKDYKYYYLLAKDYASRKESGNRLLEKMLASIVKDPAYLEMQYYFDRSDSEITKVKELQSRDLREDLLRSLQESLTSQRNLIGAYVRKQLGYYLAQLDVAFEYMSYMNLEILSRKKMSILNIPQDRTRGDIKNLRQGSQQYFWDFVGEFWADELGDYVFSLETKCN